jgi:hypothetical protein
MKHCVRLVFFSLVLFIASIPSAYSQGVSSSGTDFWCSFMPNGAPSLGNVVVLHLFIASGTSNRVHVTYAGNSTNFSVGPNSIYDMSINDAAITSQSETPTANAIHVTSSNPVTIYGYSVWTCNSCIGGSPDGFLGLPITAYGTKYYTVNFPDGYFSGPPTHGEFNIVAPYDNTNVTITPACDTRGGHKAKVPFSISLKSGDTYLVQSPGTSIGDPETDLTGTLITSSEPIALMTGHEISSVPATWLNSADHFLEMIPSEDRWGTQYFDMPMAGRTLCGDYIRVLSGEDGNQVTYNNNGPFLLNAGEYADRELVTDPEVYTSTNHKKFIVTQYSYSQGVNGDPGTADPFMILFTPQEQFEKEMIFRTPTPAKSGTFNNYVTFITSYDSIRKITINGKSIQSYQYVGLAQFPYTGTGDTMAAYRVLLPSGQHNYVAQCGARFAAYQYGFAFYEGYGWPTGMAQRIVSPDTLPPLSVILDSSCGNYTIGYFEPRKMTKGFSFDDTRIAYLALITDAGDPRWAKPSFNYTFTPDPNFTVGDSSTQITLTVTDPTQDAYAAVYAVDRAGNDTVYQYYYYAPKVTMTPSPAPYSFGTVLVDQDSCRTFSFANVQQAGDFLAKTASIIGSAKNGTFTVSPTTLSDIPAGKSVQLTVCYQPADSSSILSLDTLNLVSQCVTYRFALSGRGVTPLIFASDEDFGEVDSGQTVCKNVIIRNPGTAPLTITAQDLVNDPNFSVSPSQTFPVIIPPGGSATILYCFHPQSWGNFSAHVLFTDQNPAKYVHSIKDTSLLTGLSLPSGAKLTSYTKSITVGCSDTVLYDTVYDNLQKDKQVDSVKLVGPDAAYFTIVSQQPAYPFILAKDSGNSIPFQIQFNPTLNGMDFTPRTVTLQVYSNPLLLSLSITAQLTAPLAQLSTTSVDLGSGTVAQTLTSSFIIYNKGNAPMTVGSYGLSGPNVAAFTLTPAPPYTIPAGGQQVVNIAAIAVNNQPGSYQAFVSIAEPCNSTTATLNSIFGFNGDLAIGTTHPKTYIGGCRSDIRNATFKNLSSKDSISVVSVLITTANGANDATDFRLASSFNSTEVGPNGGSLDVPILFEPLASGPRSAALVFTLQGKGSSGQDSIWYDTVLLVGQGVSVQRTIGVGSITAPPQYHTTDLGAQQIPIVADAPIDANAPDNGTLEAYGYQFDVSWKRDVFNYNSITAPGGVTFGPPIITYNAATDMETRTFRATSITPLTGETTLGTINVTAYLNKGDTTPIVPSNVEWFGQNDTTPLCYVSTGTTAAAFNFDKQCGNTEVQKFMQDSVVVTSIREIHPNPVRNNALVSYTVRSQAPITIGIYDLLGNEVRRLVDGQVQQAGTHSITIQSEGLGSGSYYCRLTDGQQVSTKPFELEK